MNMFEDAKARIADIDRQIAMLTRQRTDLYQWVRDGERLLGIGTLTLSLTTPVAQEAQKEGGKRANSFKATVIRTAEHLLTTYPAVTSKEIVGALEQKSIEIKGANKVMAVAQVMTREKDKFISGSNGWELKK